MSEENSIILGTEQVLVDGVVKEQIYFNEGKIIVPTNKDDYFFGETVHIGTKLLNLGEGNDHIKSTGPSINTDHTTFYVPEDGHLFMGDGDDIITGIGNDLPSPGDEAIYINGAIDMGNGNDVIKGDSIGIRGPGSSLKMGSGNDILEAPLESLNNGGFIDFGTGIDYMHIVNGDYSLIQIQDHIRFSGLTIYNLEYVVTAYGDTLDFKEGNLFIKGITDDSQDGTSNTDTFVGHFGNDTFDGKDGIDTSIYRGLFSEYSFNRSSNSLEISDLRTGPNDGTDTLSNIEFIQFSDQTVEESKVDVVKTYSGNFSDYKFYNKGNGVYHIKTNSGYDDITGLPLLTFTGEAARSSFREISAIIDIKGTFDQVTGLNTDDAKMFRLYNASFKRLPDPDGLQYWIGKYSSGENDDRAVASSFLVSTEFKERYGSNVSDSTYVNNLYKNVLDREADAGGLNYWLGQLNSGAETRYEVLLGFSESAENKALFTEMTGFG